MIGAVLVVGLIGCVVRGADNPPDPYLQAQGSGGRTLLAGFEETRVAVHTADSFLEWCLLLARTDLQRARGLMQVTDPTLGGYNGMLFRYDNDVVGALYYSREIPSLLRGLRFSKLFGTGGIITFESNGLFILVRGRGLPRLILPGFHDFRGYRAMYRDFLGAIRDGRAPEMSLERAIEDQRLMDQVYCTLQ